MDIDDRALSMWSRWWDVVPTLGAFALVLVLGWVVARATRALVRRTLDHFHFERWVERGGLGKAFRDSERTPTAVVASLVYYGVWLLTLQFAFGLWGANPVSDLINRVMLWLPKAIVAMIIVVVAAAIAKALKEIILGFLGRLSYGPVLASIAHIVVLGLGVIAALNQVGVATTVTLPVLIAVLATLAGVVIVGVGGGLIKPMQERWQNWLGQWERDVHVVREHVKSQPPVTEPTTMSAPQAQSPHYSSPYAPTATGFAGAAQQPPYGFADPHQPQGVDPNAQHLQTFEYPASYPAQVPPEAPYYQPFDHTASFPVTPMDEPWRPEQTEAGGPTQAPYSPDQNQHGLPPSEGKPANQRRRNSDEEGRP